MTMPSPLPISTWRTVLEAHSALMHIYEREMHRDCGISLAWYDVLIHLAEAPGQRLRMADLAARLLLSPSWLTRRIAGMEQAGLVRRCRASADGRGVCAALTPAGARLYEQAARSHGRAIREHFLACLDPAEAATIQAAFERIAAQARSTLGQVS